MIDSDDFIEYNLVSTLNNYVKEKPDLIRFQLRTIDEDGNLISEYHEREFELTDGSKGFELITNYKYVEVSTLYLYKTSYYKKNKFSFMPGVIHEDYGLIPLVIDKAKTILSIDYIGYNYLQRNISLSHVDNYTNTKNKTFDVLKQYENLMKYNGSKYYKSYISNCAIIRSKDLNKDDKKRYISKLKELKAFDNMIDDTVLRKVKKGLYKIIYR